MVIWAAPLVIALLCLSAAPVSALAQPPQERTVEVLADPRTRAEALMLVGDYKRATALLERLVQDNPLDTEANFLLAQAYIGMQQMDDAIQVLNDILRRSPQLSRVRLELARAYTLNRQKDQAQKQFELVLATNPPRVVGDNIRQFQDAMAAQKDWNMRFSLGVLHDTNVNTGPISGTVLMFGSPFTLDRNAKPLEDNAVTASVTADFLHPFSMTSAWQTTVAGNHTGYTRYSRYDAQTLSVSTGPTWKQGATTYSVPLLLDSTQMAYELYSSSVGLAPQLQWDITGNHALLASSTVQAKAFQRAWTKNGTAWNISGAYRYTFSAGYIQPGLKYGEDDARNNIYSYTTNSANVGLYLNPYGDYTLFLQPSATVNRYRGQEDAYDVKRNDHQYSLNVNISKPLGGSGYSVVGGYTFTDNQSNIGMYSYQRQQVTLQLSKQF